MEEEKKPIEEIESEEDVISWKIQEYGGQKRSKTWYMVAGLIALGMVIYAIYTSNLIFAIIIVFSAVLLILTDNIKPKSLEAHLTDDGVQVGKEFYAYEQIEDFFIVYRPKEGIKNLYLEFKRFARPTLDAAKSGRYEWLLMLLNFVRTRLSIPLDNINPLLIRKNLLKYLNEDLEKTEIPLSEQLTKALKF